MRSIAPFQFCSHLSAQVLCSSICSFWAALRFSKASRSAVVVASHALDCSSSLSSRWMCCSRSRRTLGRAGEKAVRRRVGRLRGTDTEEEMRVLWRLIGSIHPYIDGRRLVVMAMDATSFATGSRRSGTRARAWRNSRIRIRERETDWVRAPRAIPRSNGDSESKPGKGRLAQHPAGFREQCTPIAQMLDDFESGDQIERCRETGARSRMPGRTGYSAVGNARARKRSRRQPRRRRLLCRRISRALRCRIRCRSRYRARCVPRSSRESVAREVFRPEILIDLAGDDALAGEFGHSAGAPESTFAWTPSLELTSTRQGK